MVAKPVFVTAEEFDSLPEQLDLIELIGGEIIVSPTPTRKHQKISGRLYRILEAIAEERSFGEWIQSPTAVFISDRDVFQPDLVLFSPECAPDNGSRAAEEVPLIVVEVLSPGTRAQDLVLKLPKYAARGIGECWVVDTYAHSISIHIRNMYGNLIENIVGHGKIEAGRYSGVTLPVEKIFAGFIANSWR